MVNKILVTGGNGFFGSQLIRRLLTDHTCSTVASTRTAEYITKNTQSVGVGDINMNTDWQKPLIGVDFVIHTAARVHVMKESSGDSITEYRRVNVDGTINLARQAAAAGVRRFIFLSSVKVNGEQTIPGNPFTELEPPNPQGAYAISKYYAEQSLQELSVETGMEIVIIRPPLVYGPGVKANFAALIRAVKMGLPLPLGAVYNQRSLVALDNLVDFTIACINHPQAANQIFLVSDGKDLTTAELVNGISQAIGVQARLLNMPMWALQAGAFLLGKDDTLQRLCSNLQVDISKAHRLLGWIPPVSVEEGLRRAMVV
jgi:nucleoside-diphosphate-sugar epimerase